MSDELKPCPFCGADEIEDWGEATWSQPAKWLYCTCCQARGPRILMNRGEDMDVFMSRVKADWNQRYQPTGERQHDHPPQPRETVAEADQFDRADWFWRDLAPDDSGDCPGNALQFHPELTVSLIHGSYRGPSRWVFRAEVLDPDSNDTEVLHFDTRDEAMAAAQERAAALRALKGDA